MQITKLKVQNFRLLIDSELDLNAELSILIGKNNSGKTSFLILFDKFYNSKSVSKINFDDFSLHLRKQILSINKETNVHDFSIRMILEIKYTNDDNLRSISEFITDLSSKDNTVKIALECIINSKKLCEKTSAFEPIDRENHIRKNLSEYLQYEVNIFSNETDLEQENRYKLVNKDLEFVRDLINFQLIHAKRNVASSEEIADSKRVLSQLTTKYFNSKNELDNAEVTSLNSMIRQLDKDLSEKYVNFFEPFLKNSKKILNLTNLKVASDLQSKALLSHSSKVVYGDKDDEVLPEYLNGLGYMNILYLLLNVEICKENFERSNKDINLFFIEEPEAHTHPQMQYVFAREIKGILKTVGNLQTLITTHSAYIVSQSEFKDIKYFQCYEYNKDSNIKNIVIKNFDIEMQKQYKAEQDMLLFLKKYLTIQSSEMFFAHKVIFIEGISEKILIHLFMYYHDQEIHDKIDQERKIAKIEKRETDDLILQLEDQLLLSQNITIIEAGANAKVFKYFLEFLGIKTLIITDIDSVNGENRKTCSVDEMTDTSNITLKEYLGGIGLSGKVLNEWLENLKKGLLSTSLNDINLAYQIDENGYNARSFEDAFVNSNLDLIKVHNDDLLGLKCKKLLKENIDSIYELVYGKLAEEGNSGGILDKDKKSDFASSIYFLALKEDLDGNPFVTWKVPKYIKEGLSWLAK